MFYVIHYQDEYRRVSLKSFTVKFLTSKSVSLGSRSERTNIYYISIILRQHHYQILQFILTSVAQSDLILRSTDDHYVYYEVVSDPIAGIM